MPLIAGMFSSIGAGIGLHAPGALSTARLGKRSVLQCWKAMARRAHVRAQSSVRTTWLGIQDEVDVSPCL